MSFFIMALLIVLLDILTVWGIKQVFPRFSFRYRKGIWVVFAIQIFLSLVIVIGGFFLKNHTRDYHLFATYYYLFGVMLVVYLPKGLFAIFLIFDSLAAAIRIDRRRRRHLSPRRSPHILAKVGLMCSLLLMGTIIWGILYGRYQYTIELVEIRFSNLPSGFDGFKIVQISDIHAGSFAGSTEHFQKAVDLINAQNPDIIVFTGDMVNNFAEEAYPLVPILSKLHAQEGKYAILGNHDYGGYYDWDTPADQDANLLKLEQAIVQMGFTLLNNQAVVLSKDSVNQIAIVGIENWGYKLRHPKKGDLERATESVHHIPFKILLSHDPSFWEEKIAGKTDIQLTLSGHTHGMQMGVRLLKKRYSPAQLEYQRWAGLYYEKGQYLYINRGLGVIGFPGRVGMSPEITVITLKK